MNSVSFTPHHGLLAVGQELARRCGLSHLWEGEKGLKGVAAELLDRAGVPREYELTPRSVAESAGLVKRKKGKR